MDCWRRNLVAHVQCNRGTQWQVPEYLSPLGCFEHKRSFAQNALPVDRMPCAIPNGFRSLFLPVASLLGKAGNQDVHCIDCNWRHVVPLDYSQSLWPSLRKTRRGLECRFSCQGPSSVQIAGKFRFLSVDHSSAMRILSNYPTRVMQSLHSERKNLPKLPTRDLYRMRVRQLIR